jgi:hypothetical protein
VFTTYTEYELDFMKLFLKANCVIVIACILTAACRKEKTVISPVLVKVDNTVFDIATSKKLNTHYYALDTQKAAYTLSGFGAFAGKIRTVKFSDGGAFQGVPVIQASGMDDYGYTYIAQDTAGAIWELYKTRFNSTEILKPLPITMFAPKQLSSAVDWSSTSGWEQGNNSLYFSFKTKVLNANATTSTGITGCFQLEYTAPDYKDTVYIKPGKGPVEILSWRAHLHETNQPGSGGYR